MAHNIDTASIRSGSTFPSMSSNYSHSQPDPTSPIQPSNSSSLTLIASPNPSPSYWSSSSTQSGGQRTETKTPRGVKTLAGQYEDEWHEFLSRDSNLNYSFQNPDLLEEALESPGSGTVVVGSSPRRCPEGNKGLARVGLSVMKMVLRDQCYLFDIPEKDTDAIIDRIIGWRNLYKVGLSRKIERVTRPRKDVRPSRRYNILSQLKEDAVREDPSRTVARAVKAVIGAVYYDGGYESARRVLAHLGLIIQP